MACSRQSLGRRTVGALVFVCAGCTPAPELPDLEAIYARVGTTGTVNRPLITVPGTLGSRLVDSETGTVIWGGGSKGLSADPDDPFEAELIALPIISEDEPISEIRDSVVSDGVLDEAEAEILGIPIPIEIYGGILNTLAAGGFRSISSAGGGAAEATPEVPDAAPEFGATFEQYAEITEDPANSFRFDYDWRRDLPSLAKDFDRFVQQRKRRVAAIRSLREGRTIEPEEVRFDLLAHSMGGLVTRYYLMHGPADLPEDGPLPPVTWEGAKHFNRVIIVATPNAGSIIAVDNLVNGKSFGPLQPVYSPTLLATHPSVWQLFPRSRHGRIREGSVDGARLDPLDADLWRRYSWGLLDTEHADLLDLLLPDVADPFERRQIAARHQARLIRRARRFHEAMDRWAPKPPWLEMYLVVGGGFRTPAVALADPDTAELEIADFEEGDGVVLRTSVLLDDRVGREGGGGLDTPLRFDTTLFLPDEHVELTKNPVFGDNLLFWLLEQPRDQSELARPGRGSGLLRDAPALSPDAVEAMQNIEPGTER